MATIEDLYRYFGVLADAKEDAGKVIALQNQQRFLDFTFFGFIFKHVDTYLKIIECTKYGPKEKQLASQFITRFFKHFPKDTGNIAIDALFDLCEDEDVNVGPNLNTFRS
jgi:hypothetical protein